MERKLIAVAVSSALGLPLAANAVEGSVSGHVNRAVIVETQDGNPNDGDLQFMNANGSETRFRMKGSEELDNGLTVGVNLEVGAGGGAYGYGTTITGDDDDGHSASNGDFRIRHANVSLSSAGGTLTFGQQSTPTDGVPYADVGSSWIGGATNWCSYGGSGAACNTFGGGRQQIVRYDTPSMGPASVSVSAGNDEFFDARLNINGSVGDASYDLRAGYNGGDGSEAVLASASVTVGHTGVAVAWGSAENGDGSADDADYAYIKLDHSYGDGSVAVYYKQGDDAGVEGSLWGLAVGHSLGGGATVYAGYRFVESDNAEDLDLIVAGMRVTFN